MSPSKIVIAITGSIAAYKAADLISTLTRQGHQVKVILSKNAEKFIGRATLQTLSKNLVYQDDFAPESLMSHIDLGKWCDLALVYPATAQTINALAHGAGADELINSFFLAYDFQKPLWFAPAMNTRMLHNPITQNSIQTLKKIGCRFFETEHGNLACGEEGLGRLIDPAKVSDVLFKNQITPPPSKRILITAGGTRENIDGVRSLTNMSTGKTGAELADALADQGYQVMLLTSRFAVMPKNKVNVTTYESFQEIDQTLKALAKTKNYDMILHAAAISDYSIARILTPEGERLPQTDKMSSRFEKITLELKRNEKILPQLKALFGYKTTVVGFKLTSTESVQEQAKAIFSLFTNDAVDYVVHNDMNDIRKGQREFLVTSKEGEQQHVTSTGALAIALSQLIQKNKNQETSHDLMS